MIGKSRQTKGGNGLYEQVLTKNFQIIETFLTQFHELFTKQDQFEAALSKLEGRVALSEKSFKKIEQNIVKSTEMYEKKMKSLKEFILQKMKNTNQKIQYIPIQPQSIDRKDHFQLEKSIQAHYEYHVLQQKKMEEHVYEHIKKLDWQINSITQKLNGLTMLANNIDERVGLPIKTSENRSICQSSVQSLRAKTESELELIKKVIYESKELFIERAKELQRKIENGISFLVKRIGEQKEKQKKSLDLQIFQQFKNSYKQDQECMVREIKEIFANKKQTKQYLNLLEKKLTKLQLVQQIVKQVNENELQNITVVPAKMITKSYQNSIHTHPNSTKQALVSPKDSINIRRLSCNKLYKSKVL